MLARHTGRNQHLFLQCPDLVIGSAGQPHTIADTKWKQLGADWLKAVSSDDIRQIYTYGRLYKAKNVILIYPTDGGAPRTEHLVTNDDANLTITIAEIPICRGSLDGLNKHLQKLVFHA